MNKALFVDGISYHTGEKVILDNISFSVYNNETVAILGENGAGKTTLLNIILKDIPYNSGIIEFYSNRNFNKKEIGACYDNLNILSLLKVSELIHLFCTFYSLNFTNILNQYSVPFKLQEINDTYICKLSMGERKRIAVLLSIIHNPRFLIMDEPFSNIDPSLLQTLWKNIKTKDRTILYSTHNWEEAANSADKVIFMSKGKIISDPDTPTNILSKLPSHTILGIENCSNKILDYFKGLEYYQKDSSTCIFINENFNFSDLNMISDCPIKKMKAGLLDAYLYLSNINKKE
ncbi:ABC-2 type transport system ATP-binding protein [Dysgonomonas sp. PFB1-18]|uniref:ATP-binding cassette domain-containing protein n=1 Tax=unclassified Dysgonomonas TaxID=2630389 RepID=UPI00247328F9|nr:MULTISPECIES: ABC transporter ATP-binding protein [unclassified Dysgonomonas]MDH6310950.1 ABC-2 type transport system ATP-binding protein [Dysgonomonas sp. PF1-14]MDH6340835.1 ABC-2 type transport system ATP-binding protein [Dysgonomonas sp. PF1-16]MDH6382473.1 ABC-2 type transport system ATP-binding protein [Dysgonomonas sp. PFB1-18]MDH6399822.1 ABC-2 type transport system ATP-binding protein [Dysgonomonas sp. PF1-23]